MIAVIKVTGNLNTYSPLENKNTKIFLKCAYTLFIVPYSDKCNTLRISWPTDAWQKPPIAYHQAAVSVRRHIKRPLDDKCA